MRAYQRVQPLTIGELWAIAITLRIVLVDNLRRLAEQIVHRRAARQKADELADDLLGLGPDGTGRPRRCPAPALAERAPDGGLRVQLVQRLRDQDPAVTPALGWLEELLAAQGTTAEEMVRLEHQRQATMNVTVRNVITSMRLISVVRLGGVRRERQPGRRGPARGERLRRAWTSRPGIATGTRSRSWPGAPA